MNPSRGTLDFVGDASSMRHSMLITILAALPILAACPDPPPEITAGISDQEMVERNNNNRGGPEGDPDSLDLSPGGTMLLDMAQVVPQQSQEELAGTETVTISGTLMGTCDGGMLRIDIIEIGGEHSDQGPMIGPLTSLLPTEPGDYTLVAPKGKNIQVAALCDIDKDGKIVQGTDKLAPGIALGEIEEDHDGVDLVFPGESDTPVEVGNPTGGGITPPGDQTASLPSAEAGARDRGDEVEPPPAGTNPPVPPPPAEEAAPAEDAAPTEEAAPTEDAAPTEEAAPTENAAPTDQAEGENGNE